MKHGRECIPIKIVAGSGLALAATVSTIGDTVIRTVITQGTDSEDLIAAITTTIGLAVT